MVGINKYDDKSRRRERRRNHIARDLALSKYHQRIIPSARRIRKINTEDDDVFYEDVRYDDTEDL